MIFSSLFFLCVFLPVCLGLYYLIKNRTHRNWILIISSLFFYAWGEPVWVTLLLFSTFFDYFGALIVWRNRNNWKGKAAVIACVAVNLLILGFFKYSGFIVDNINAILGTNFQIIRFGLPIGISFYTFQILSYVLDVYRGEVEVQQSPFKLLLYISMFHQLVAGPIVRYSDIAYEIDNRIETIDQFNAGVNRFIIGLGKKVIFANTMGEVSGIFLGTDYSRLPVLGAWYGIALFALQIFFDFSGYSDMAIGLGKMFGFTYKENFNYPYISKSATEFWRRWHISLSTFFRDYVYIPLGGNRKHQLRNLFVVWALTGLWHGASWNFVIWGIYYFVLLFIEKNFLLKLFEKLPPIISRLYLWIAVIIGWVFFYHTDMGQAVNFLGIMLGINAPSFSNPEVDIHFMNNAVMFTSAIIGCTPLAKSLYQKVKDRMGGNGYIVYTESIAKPVINICILILSIILLVGQTYNPFLYFRF